MHLVDRNGPRLPAPRIIVDPPLSPRLGHLHITLDDLPWHWVGSSYEDSTIAVVGLPPGQHKIMVEVVDAQHRAFTACAECKQTITFTVPGT